MLPYNLAPPSNVVIISPTMLVGAGELVGFTDTLGAFDGARGSRLNPPPQAQHTSLAVK